jgi:hypothetical protein
MGVRRFRPEGNFRREGNRPITVPTPLTAFLFFVRETEASHYGISEDPTSFFLALPGAARDNHLGIAAASSPQRHPLQRSSPSAHIGIL